MTMAARAAVTDARAAAAEITADIRAGELLDPSFDRRTARLDPRDRRWTRELVYGMLRRRSWLDAMLADRVSGGLVRLDADVTDLLRLGTQQLLFMGSVPAYAAIAQTVELVKRRHGMGASKLANAVLRRVDREREQLVVAEPEELTDALALAHSHPRWVVARWLERFGEHDTRALLEANNGEAPLVARPYHVVREQLEAMLEGAGVQTADAPLVSDSILLSGGVSALTELGAFRQGLFHLQDPASTLVTKYACVPSGATVADLCAAPGGKALELARDASVVYAGDASRARLARVQENVVRLDAANVIPFVGDATMPAIREVDVVTIDVPCTGTGTFRRHPDARWRLKASDLAVLPALQRAILRGAATVVKPGGLLVYSTCSLEPEENDEQIAYFLAAHPGWLLEPPPSGAVPDTVLDQGVLRCLPHRHATDGTFAARLRRPRTATVS
ncbi:MAG: 16S rRNA (cytosine(967)-C(5))-methyltransferase RsmB [Gemmatimonadaceae bacterium]|nr:16S rRNA (cytosine(967)-C(5))-methyltransferase RsmB [Gemmatimonadaceae bacterium]